MKIRASKEFIFNSAHYLKNYQGNCKKLHGHTYKLIVTVEDNINKETGMVIDFNKFTETDSNTEDDEDEPTFEKLTISITPEQKEVINSAIKRVKNDTGDWQVSDGRCIELICADYLAG